MRTVEEKKRRRRGLEEITSSRVTLCSALSSIRSRRAFWRNLTFLLWTRLVLFQRGSITKVFKERERDVTDATYFSPDLSSFNTISLLLLDFTWSDLLLTKALLPVQMTKTKRVEIGNQAFASLVFHSLKFNRPNF